jgi:hypothetical protein
MIDRSKRRNEMEEHLKNFFGKGSDEPRGCFHRVIPLHEAPDIDWKMSSKQGPELSKGWYELSRLPPKDRIEFTRDYWLAKLPYRPGFSEFLLRFFDALEDIGIFITQKKFDEPYNVHLIYSLIGDSGFYRGGPPASEQEIRQLQRDFSEFLLPADYLAFLQIHNGFWKTTDVTGIARIQQMRDLYENLQEMLANLEVLTTTEGTEVDPTTLIPFYESFGMPFFQCFWAEWYPEEEMGNVYYSTLSKTISCTKESVPSAENMAFATFIDWLKFYLEPMA